VFRRASIGRKSVVDRRRIRVLGGEPVVDGDDLGVRPPADLRGQVGGEEGVPHHVHAAVEVENDVARFDSVDRDLGGWDAAQSAAVTVTSAGSGCADTASFRVSVARRRRCRRGTPTVAGSHRRSLRCSVLTGISLRWDARPSGCTCEP
jgi:hypothetical protein